MAASDSAAGTLVGFARTLRAAGVDASTDRVLEALRALDVLDPSRRDDVYWAGRLAFCASHDDVERYEAAFASYFAGETARTRPRQRQQVQRTVVAVPLADPDTPEAADDRSGEGRRRPAAASRTEVLRERDIARLSAEERAELERLLASFRMPGEVRPSRRMQAAHRGRVDRARTVRELLRRGGEPARLRFQAHRERPRRVVLLIDVSGSMSSYADALLRFAHAASRRRELPTEVFTIGTRLTRVTDELAHRDPDWAMREVGAAVPDWRGGTRLGQLLKAFLDRWGQRGMARGAVVVVLSDGWERGDVTLLASQMARLARLAHRVVWANPRKGQTGYQPLATGMAAALPYCDDFVAGHSLAALEELAAVVRNTAAPGSRAVRGAVLRRQGHA
jgi:uncharacterized protein